MTAAPVVLRPLHCSGCGASLPLGKGKTTRCAYCDTEAEIPPEYGEVQRVAQGFLSNQLLAEQLYSDVGRPPGRLLRALGRGVEASSGVASGVGMMLLGIVFSQPVLGVGMCMAAAYGLGFPVAALARLLGRVAGHPIQGPLSPIPVLAAGALLAVLLIGVPIVLLGREKALAGVRRDIHGSLAAGMPEHPGGPSRCRGCGAALEVPRGALGVPCAYCKADNLVALPQPWVDQIRASEFHHFLSIDAALEAFRKVSRETTEKLWQLTFGLIFVFPVILGLAVLLEKAHIRY